MTGVDWFSVGPIIAVLVSFLLGGGIYFVTECMQHGELGDLKLTARQALAVQVVVGGSIGCMVAIVAVADDPLTLVVFPLCPILGPRILDYAVRYLGRGLRFIWDNPLGEKGE